VAAEDGLPECLDVRDPFVEGNHDRQAPEEQDEDGDDDQPPDGDGQDGVIEIGEGCPGSDVHEASNVEEKIDDRTEHGLLGLSIEETVPSESSTTAKRGKEVISAEHCTSTDHQKGEGNVLGNVRLTIDQPLPLAKLHEVSETEAEDRTVNYGEDDLIWSRSGDRWAKVWCVTKKRLT